MERMVEICCGSYYDGLYYVLRAIKKAKSEVACKINNKLREKLG